MLSIVNLLNHGDEENYFCNFNLYLTRFKIITMEKLLKYFYISIVNSVSIKLNIKNKTRKH